jgi:hypothetical protein
MKKIIFFLLILTSLGMAMMNISLDAPYEGLTSNSVIEIVYDSSGVWLGTAGGASYLADGDSVWTTFTGNSGLHSTEVSALAASVWHDTTLVCIATLHSEQIAGDNVPTGDGFSITTDGGETWLADSLTYPANATYYGKLSYDLDIYQNDIYSACFYGGLVRSTDAGHTWDNLYLNASDSLDQANETFYSYSNRYFSVKVDKTLAPDTISVFAGTAYGINRFVFTGYDDVSKQDTAWQIAHSSTDIETSLPGNHVVALGITGEPGRIYDMFVRDSLAYIAHDYKGLYVVNVRNPNSPSIVGNYDTDGRVYGVFVDGDYAYVADYDDGLQVLDIRGASPTSAGEYIPLSGRIVNVIVSGDYAYLANDVRGLQIIRILESDSLSIHFEAEYLVDGGVMDVCVDSSHAYLAAGTSGMIIVDISDPAYPAVVASYDSLDFANEIAINSDVVYIADRDMGLVALDVSDPASPTLVDSYGTPGECRSVYFDNDNIYATDGIALRVFQLLPGAEGDTLAYIGGYDTPGTANDVVVSGDVAYVADNYSGMQILDVATGDSIYTLGNFAPVCSTYIWAGCRVGVGETGQGYGVAYSTDYGKSWTTVFDEPAWDFAFWGDTVFVATDNGLYYSDNYANWEVITELDDVTGLRKFFPSGFYAVEIAGSDLWAGGADGSGRSEDFGDTWNVFRSQLYANEHYAYPSPFSPIASTRKGTTIHYKPDQTTTATVKIYDFNLDLVATVADGVSRTGGVESDNDVWFGKNDKGELVANGVYFYNIKLGTGEDWWGKVAVVK